jgi:ketosteroid isomerase-like protein
MTMPQRPLETVHAALQAYVDKDRSAIESLTAADYHFTSPMDNALDREAYLRICWPNSQEMAGFNIVHEAEAGDVACVVYEARTAGGKRFRNSEVHTVRDGKLVRTEVYFGWDLPHKVARGEHRG